MQQLQQCTIVVGGNIYVNDRACCFVLRAQKSQISYNETHGHFNIAKHAVRPIRTLVRSACLCFVGWLAYWILEAWSLSSCLILPLRQETLLQTVFLHPGV